MSSISCQLLRKSFVSHKKQAGLKASLRSLLHREYVEHVAVRDITFSIEQGELVGMLGANGAGKTTTLKMLSGLLHPDAGDAQVLGFRPWERKVDFRKNISIVMGQRNQLWWDLPAADSFLLNKEMYGIRDADFKERLDVLCSALDIEDKLSIQLRRLSLGERMKCELVGALLHAPKVVFLDEPTIGLDVVAQHALRNFIERFNRENDTTIVLTSHYMDDIKALCKRVILIDEGQILFDGALEKLVERFVDDKVLNVRFAQAVDSSDLVSYGQLSRNSEDEATLRVRRSEVPRVAAELLNRFEIVDLTIEEVPIEDVIRLIFSNQSASEHPNSPSS